MMSFERADVINSVARRAFRTVHTRRPICIGQTDVARQIIEPEPSPFECDPRIARSLRGSQNQRPHTTTSNADFSKPPALWRTPGSSLRTSMGFRSTSMRCGGLGNPPHGVGDVGTRYSIRQMFARGRSGVPRSAKAPGQPMGAAARDSSRRAPSQEVRSRVGTSPTPPQGGVGLFRPIVRAPSSVCAVRVEEFPCELCAVVQEIRR